MENISVYDMVQILGQSEKYSDIVCWFGDYSVYEKRVGINDEHIRDAYQEYISAKKKNNQIRKNKSR